MHHSGSFSQMLSVSTLPQVLTSALLPLLSFSSVKTLTSMHVNPESASVESSLTTGNRNRMDKVHPSPFCLLDEQLWHFLRLLKRLHQDQAQLPYSSGKLCNASLYYSFFFLCFTLTAAPWIIFPKETTCDWDVSVSAFRGNPDCDIKIGGQKSSQHCSPKPMPCCRASSFQRKG